MKSNWPKGALINAEEFLQFFSGPANALGIDITSDLNSIAECDFAIAANPAEIQPTIKGLEQRGIAVRPSSNNFEKLSNFYEQVDSHQKMISVLVARSPHGQAATWAPTLIKSGVTITPVPGLTENAQTEIQQKALEMADQIKLIGVISVQFQEQENEFRLVSIGFNIDLNCLWTIEGATTSYFEQYLRAVLDLPLGDTSLVKPNTVVGTISIGSKSDMYRPYLHLMARTPTLKFYQYRKSASSRETAGHISISGSELDYLIEEIEHAQAYFSGEIED